MRVHPKNVKTAADREWRRFKRVTALSLLAGVLVGVIAGMTAGPGLRELVGILAGLGTAFITLVVLLLI